MILTTMSNNMQNNIEYGIWNINTSTGDKTYHIGKYAMKNMQVIQYINILSLLSRDERNTGCILHLLYILMIRRSILHKWLI